MTKERAQSWEEDQAFNSTLQPVYKWIVAVARKMGFSESAITVRRPSRDALELLAHDPANNRECQVPFDRRLIEGIAAGNAAAKKEAYAMIESVLRSKR